MSETGGAFDEHMLLMICETNFASRLVQLLDELGTSGYTSFGGVSGVGEHGRHEGTVVWPGTNTLMFTVVEDEDMIERIMQGAEEIIESEYATRPGFKAFRLPVESID